MSGSLPGRTAVPSSFVQEQEPLLSFPCPKGKELVPWRTPSKRSCVLLWINWRQHERSFSWFEILHTGRKPSRLFLMSPIIKRFLLSWGTERDFRKVLTENCSPVWQESEGRGENTKRTIVHVPSSFLLFWLFGHSSDHWGWLRVRCFASFLKQINEA